MAAHGIGPVPDIEDIEVDDEATRLTKLLVAAGSLLGSSFRARGHTGD